MALDLVCDDGVHFQSLNGAFTRAGFPVGSPGSIVDLDGDGELDLVSGVTVRWGGR